jgi:hypothetical protein
MTWTPGEPLAHRVDLPHRGEVRGRRRRWLGIEHKHRFTPEDNQKALELLTRATELDPNLARVYVGLTMVHLVAFDNGWTSSPEASLDSMLKALRKALALDPSDGQAHLTLASGNRRGQGQRSTPGRPSIGERSCRGRNGLALG